MTVRGRRISVFGLTLPIRCWVPLLALPLVLAALLFVALGHGLLEQRQQRLQDVAIEQWRVLEPALIATGASEADRLSQLRQMAAAMAPLSEQPARTALLRWSPLVLTVLALALFAALAHGLWRLRHDDQVLQQGRARHQQAAILTLLDEMAPLADGDLTVRATVDEAMTGALADAFNQAVSALRELVARTGESSSAVFDAVSTTRESTQALSAAASVQSREILRASNYLNALSGATAELALNADASARKASAAGAAAHQGRVALQAAGEQLDRIRDESALTMRLTHRLADNVRAIDAEVETVRRIAQRSDLLSLNTTVRAAAAAQQVAGSDVVAASTSDYARLADDVSDLAAVLGSVSREIAGLTAVIRDDADETLRAMQTTDAALAAGVEGAATLYRQLEAIDADASDLDALSGDTARRAARQADVVRRLSENMSVLNRLGRDGASGIAQVGESLDRLQALAEALDASVAGFRLPGRARSGAARHRG